MAPDLRRQVDAVRAARLAQLAETKKHVEAQVSFFAPSLLRDSSTKRQNLLQSVDTDDVKPIWADPPRK